MVKTTSSNDETKLVSGGRNPKQNYGIVNPPVYHASTVISPTLKSWRNRDPMKDIVYGRVGTPTQRALEEAVALVEEGDRAITTASGLGAIAVALTSFTKSGDHILMADSAYFPARAFCNNVLAKYGVETSFYDPQIGAGIADIIQDNTTIVYTENPGSLTFEMQDIPAIANAAHERGAIVLHDNTWGTPLFYKSFQMGIDISIHAATKYIVGHSDAMLGVLVTKEKHFETLFKGFRSSGQHAAPDDCYLALRGLRTMSVRLNQHQKNAIIVANWLESRSEVKQVLYPALESHPGHELWKRDFLGACGLFSIILDKHYDDTQLGSMLDHMNLFAMGASWGGYESLILPGAPPRTATTWDPQGTLLRLHIGLENSDDLITDLDKSFARLKRK